MAPQPTPVLKPAAVRHNNYRSILLTVRELGVCTVADIAARLSLSKTAIFKAILHLTELGFVLSAGKGTSSAAGGKPPEKYSVNPNCRYTCVINFYHDLIIVYIHNFAGGIVHQTSFPFPDFMVTDVNELLAYCCAWISQTLSFCQLEPKHLCGVIFLYDTTPARHNAIFQCFKNPAVVQELKARLAEKLGIPNVVYVENPKDMRGYAELQADQSRRQKLVAVVSVLKEEVTGCILHYGRVLHGAGNMVGNFAHMPTDFSMTTQCSCGRRGCFASAVLRDPILKRLAIELKSGTPSSLQGSYQARTMSMVDVTTAADAGDELAGRHMDFVLENYTRLIYMVYLTLNPDELVLQIGPNGREFHERELNRRFHALDLPSPGGKDVLKISTSSIEPYKATAIGAANYCIDNFLDNPACFDG